MIGNASGAGRGVSLLSFLPRRERPLLAGNSSERIEELWGVVGLYGSMEELCHWGKYGDMNL